MNSGFERHKKELLRLVPCIEKCISEIKEISDKLPLDSTVEKNNLDLEKFKNELRNNKVEYLEKHVNDLGFALVSKPFMNSLMEELKEYKNSFKTKLEEKIKEKTEKLQTQLNFELQKKQLIFEKEELRLQLENEYLIKSQDKNLKIELLLRKRETQLETQLENKLELEREKQVENKLELESESKHILQNIKEHGIDDV